MCIRLSHTLYARSWSLQSPLHHRILIPNREIKTPITKLFSNESQCFYNGSMALLQHNSLLSLHHHIHKSSVLLFHQSPLSASPYNYCRKPSRFTSPSSCISVSGSSSPSQTDKEAREQLNGLLLKDCGFTDKQLSYFYRVTKGSKVSPQRAKEVVQLFKNSGFTRSQIKSIVSSNSSVLRLRPNETIKPKIDFFKEKKLLSLLIKCPRILNNSVENTIIPRIDFLRTFHASEASLHKTLKTSPDILLIDVENKLEPTLEVLREFDISRESLPLSIISYCPKILLMGSDEIKNIIEFIKSMGVDINSKQLRCAVKVVVEVGLEVMKNKFSRLRELGLTEEDAKEIFLKQPLVFRYCSHKKMKRVVDFFVDVAGLPPSYVAKDPWVLLPSLDRLKSRYKILKEIAHSQPGSAPFPPLGSACFYRDSEFLDKYVNSRPDAEKLVLMLHGE